VRDEERHNGTADGGRERRDRKTEPQVGRDIELCKTKRIGTDAEERAMPE
jgi:hypothetical protein